MQKDTSTKLLIFIITFFLILSNSIQSQVTEKIEFDSSKLNTIPVENYFAYREAGRFAGWPANNGAWSWGNEILVGFSVGYFNPDNDREDGHEIRRDMPSEKLLSRSLDGGVTWSVEKPANYFDSEVDNPSNYNDSPGINFTHPGFAMSIDNKRYFISYDKGRSWEGPYSVNIKKSDGNLGELTSRTDYLVLSPDSCLVFMSAKTGLVKSNYQDRSFCALSSDGGKTFVFQGWMTQNTEARSVMSSTVRAGQSHLISIMRRKVAKEINGEDSFLNWIEAAESKDNGKTWTNIGKVAETDNGKFNGNPPALVRLKDGRLIVAYGYRAKPYGMRVKISKDNGKSWGDEIILRYDGRRWDLGYPRMVVRTDGRIVTMYYYTTEQIPEQYIQSTIWDPGNIGLDQVLTDTDKKSVAHKIDTIFLPGQVRLDMVRIAPGTFQMGTVETEEGYEPDESPLHSVTIGYSFYMGKTEITQAQWEALMGKWPNQAPEERYGKGSNFPAYFISWHDCQKFIKALNEYIKKTGQGSATFRLPSEAEWEYSCRAGTDTRFFFGEDANLADEYMWYKGNSDPTGKSVGQKKPNPWGLYDISGNLWEWCDDYYHPNYEGAPIDGSVWRNPTNEFVILRSGDNGLSADKCRCANRNDHRTPDDTAEDVGFRLARTK